MKFTEEEKKIRVVERAIRKNWDSHEKNKKRFLEDIEIAIKHRDYEKEDLNQLFENVKTNEDYDSELEKEITYRARILNRSELKIYRMKKRYYEIYKEEVFLK